MGKPTHRETCRAVAQLLNREAWADVVCWELGVGGRQLDVLAVSGLGVEGRNQHRLQAWTSRQAWPAPPEERRPTPLQPRVMVAEVKMSRADLQAGLRRGQLEAYQTGPVQPSHLLLVVWEEALVGPGGVGFWDEACVEAALKDLAGLGVPEAWGVARASPTYSRSPEVMISILRRPPRLNGGGDLLHRLGLVELAARSFSFRALSKTSPMKMEP